jgi:hypothetical protein
MKIIYRKILPLILLLFIIEMNNSIAQSITNNENAEIEKIFDAVQNGIKSKSVKEFSANLLSEVYISLENGTNSYFSSSQSYHILNDYFNQLEHVSYNVIKKQSSSEKPFIVGQIRYSKKGIPASAQVFITLIREDGAWQVSQIIIN